MDKNSIKIVYKTKINGEEILVVIATGHVRRDYARPIDYSCEVWGAIIGQEPYGSSCKKGHAFEPEFGLSTLRVNTMTATSK